MAEDPKVNIETQTKDADPEEVSALNRRIQQAHVLWEAFILYVKTPGCSVSDVWREGQLPEDEDSSGEPQYFRDLVSLDTMRKYARDRNWVGRRKAQWEAIEAAVLQQAQDDEIRRQTEEVRKLDQVGEVLLNNITGVVDENGEIIVQAVQPKSLEGAVGALVNLDKWKHTKREKIAEAKAKKVVDELEEAANANSSATPRIPDNMTVEEVEDLARQMVLKRAQRVNASLNGSGDE